MKRALHLVFSNYESDPRPRRMAEALRDAGWSVTAMGLGEAHDAPEASVDGVTVEQFHTDRYRGQSVGRYLSQYARFMAWASLRIARRHGVFDLVHVHAPPDFVVLAALPARIRGARVLLDIHDLTPELFRSRFGERAWADVTVRMVERLSTSAAHVVLTASETFKASLIGRGIAEDRVHVIMNLPDESIFWREEIPDAPKEPTVSYHGTLVPRYGPDIALEAAAILAADFPDLRVRIIGDGDQRQELVARAALPDLAGRVDFSDGRVPITEIPRALDSVTVGLVPNRPEGYGGKVLPTKLLEYAALGIPAVVTRSEGVSAYFERDELLTVDSPDPAGFAAEVARVINDPAFARSRVLSARDFFRRHSWSEESKRYVALAEGVSLPRSSA